MSYLSLTSTKSLSHLAIVNSKMKETYRNSLETFRSGPPTCLQGNNIHFLP